MPPGSRGAFSRECKPHFIGVWDTVASIGWVRRKQFSNNRLNPDVAHACQALALDERRHHFRVSLWDETGLPPGQTIEQVWFPRIPRRRGRCRRSDRRISDISLEWMLRHAGSKGLKLRPGLEGVPDSRPFRYLGTLRQAPVASGRERPHRSRGRQDPRQRDPADGGPGRRIPVRQSTPVL